MTLCRVRLVTTKCQCQAKRTARCGCVKRITPHSSFENFVHLHCDYGLAICVYF